MPPGRHPAHAARLRPTAAMRSRYRQGAGVGGLLEAFDALRQQHAAMAADKFNDDGTYKAGIIQVPRVAWRT